MADSPPISSPTVHYQIFQDGRPLTGLRFNTKREARRALRELPSALVAQSLGWYRVEIRRGGAIGNILGIRKYFDDGSEQLSTFTVRRVSFVTVPQYQQR